MSAQKRKSPTSEASPDAKPSRKGPPEPPPTEAREPPESPESPEPPEAREGLKGAPGGGTEGNPASPVGNDRLSESLDERSAEVLAEAADGELARRVAAGCRLSAEVLIVRHQSSVRGFLARLSGDASLADDLAQETFVRMLRHAGSFDDRFSMKTWLLTIGRRLLINHHRKQARIKSPAAASDPVTAKEDSPYERTARQDRQSFLERKLAQAMQSLSEAQRDVLVLFYQQQRTIQEIAGMLDLPEGTVKSHLHRARAAVRKNLDLDAEGTERKSTETSRQDQ